MTIGLVLFSLCSVLKSRTNYSYVKSLTAIFTVFICVTMDMNKLNNKNKVIYTGCPRRNVKYFGRVFLMLNYTDITQNTYIQS